MFVNKVGPRCRAGAIGALMMFIGGGVCAQSGTSDLRSVLDANVRSHNVGAVVGLVAKSGHVVFAGAAGEMSPGVPMRIDAIVPVSSISKPITAIAILKLIDAGKLRVDDPVAKYLPAFHAMFVETKAPGGRVIRESLIRPITIRDLLTHEAGFAAQGQPLWDIWDKATTAGEFSDMLARVPLDSQPGAQFEYGPAYEVLVAVAEKVTGRTFEDYVANNVLLPLKMRDTHYFVPSEKLARIPAQYTKDSKGVLSIATPAGHENPRSLFFSGGGGLRSTVTDYFRLGTFLLNRGELDGARLLPPQLVSSMTSNQVGSLFSYPGYGWGYGLEIRIAPAPDEMEGVGSFGWEGGTGTFFRVDPCEQLIVVLFAPTKPGTAGLQILFHEFMNAAYKDTESTRECSVRHSR